METPIQRQVDANTELKSEALTMVALSIGLIILLLLLMKLKLNDQAKKTGRETLALHVKSERRQPQ